jgi:hypothetical protein
MRGGRFRANGQHGDAKVREDGIVNCGCSKPRTQMACRRSVVARDNRYRKGARHPGLGTKRRGGLSQDSGYLPALPTAPKQPRWPAQRLLRQSRFHGAG